MSSIEHITKIEHDNDRHRWVCSCQLSGKWKPRKCQATQGASKHMFRLKQIAQKPSPEVQNETQTSEPEPAP